jgi:hypothetical protein
MDANTSIGSMRDEAVPGAAVQPERAVQLLAHGQVELLGQVLDSSNFTFLARVDDGDLRALAIYKPRRGERPLWDFPRGTLCLREAAAYVLSRALGWPLIPPTVLREGPYGLGAFQLYIDADPEASYFSLRHERLADLLPVALFDTVANNADRKGGHLLLDAGARIWAIDNALTFHHEPKLRTVIWDFAGEAIPDERVEDLRRLRRYLARRSHLRQTLERLLAAEEMAALRGRLAALLNDGAFPLPDPSRRQVPWPVV